MEISVSITQDTSNQLAMARNSPIDLYKVQKHFSSSPKPTTQSTGKTTLALAVEIEKIKQYKWMYFEQLQTLRSENAKDSKIVMNRLYASPLPVLTIALILLIILTVCSSLVLSEVLLSEVERWSKLPFVWSAANILKAWKMKTLQILSQT